MAITFLPGNLLRRIAPKKKARRLVTQKLTVNRVALRSLARTGVLSQKKLTEVAIKVVRQYRAKERSEKFFGASETAARETALNKKKLMVQRVQNAAVFELGKEVRSQYRGELARWLPSDAQEPDPLHQLNYGEIFQIGVGINGEEPGERYGCRCGMEILVEEDRLEL